MGASLSLCDNPEKPHLFANSLQCLVCHKIELDSSLFLEMPCSHYLHENCLVYYIRDLIRSAPENTQQSYFQQNIVCLDCAKPWNCSQVLHIIAGVFSTSKSILPKSIHPHSSSSPEVGNETIIIARPDTSQQSNQVIIEPAQGANDLEPLSCNLCLQTLPRLQFVGLRCGHNVCKSCVKQVLLESLNTNSFQYGQIGCPECSQKMSENILLNSMDRQILDRLEDQRHKGLQRLNNASELGFKLLTCKGFVGKGTMQPLLQQGEEQNLIDYLRRVETLHEAILQGKKPDGIGEFEACKAIISFSQIDMDMYQIDFCRQCKLPYCLNGCTSAHIGMECGQYRVLPKNLSKDQNEFLDLINREGISVCPTCGAGIEKIDGCNHVLCAMCKNYMCYVCRVRWNDTDHESHQYDEESEDDEQLYGMEDQDEEQQQQQYQEQSGNNAGARGPRPLQQQMQSVISEQQPRTSIIESLMNHSRASL